MVGVQTPVSLLCVCEFMMVLSSRLLKKIKNKTHQVTALTIKFCQKKKRYMH